MLYILTNADGHEKPKLYSFLHNDGKPLVKEITEDLCARAITGGREKLRSYKMTFMNLLCRMARLLELRTDYPHG